MSDGRRMAGGFDGGAVRDGDTVVRRAGAWSPAVQALLAHLAAKGFTKAPRPVSINNGRERLSFLDGVTVGATRPWPEWVHTDAALLDVAHWLRDYHQAVADFVPSAAARWREPHEQWWPGLTICPQ